MADPPTILKLIENGTLGARVAATLWAAVDRGLSFVVVALPRLAGKTTLTNAMLSLLPPHVPIHRLMGDEEQMARLKEEATGGYLVVGEFSQVPVPTYIWGAPVRRVFDTLEAGYSLATALHARGLEETFRIICQGNGVTDQQASRIGMMLYILRFGNGMSAFRRRLAQVHEIDYVESGRPHGRLLHHWIEGEDRFEAVDVSRLLQGDEGELEARAARMEEMVKRGLTAAEDVARLVAEYPRTR